MEEIKIQKLYKKVLCRSTETPVPNPQSPGLGETHRSRHSGGDPVPAFLSTWLLGSVHPTFRRQLLSGLPSPRWLCCVGMSPASLGHRRQTPGSQNSDLLKDTMYWAPHWGYLSCLKTSWEAASGCCWYISRQACAVQVGTHISSVSYTGVRARISAKQQLGFPSRGLVDHGFC